VNKYHNLHPFSSDAQILSIQTKQKVYLVLFVDHRAEIPDFSL